ncbi:Acg family FMN-binding oxidoreductase [Thioalkalivibrio sulfidiphilus]|uniref:Tat pathway signal protein n=2 Tax=Thioalkalivibrio TaxID=106633 RepID=B8GMY9_THISH|nr:twin-arginine translocation signal domain-containing protein [Thioalkalivibrio sulfidiphilus]ACL73804.1 conserved hypothetical protein [Thioalkalivibrio sulfidiphilus HL-EbGr7]
MMSRRQFIAAAAVAGSGIAVGAYALHAQNARTQYQRHVEQTWRHGSSETVQGRELLLELVRYATLAPSSHNTQCWKFRLGESAVTLLPDFQRRCPVVDPDDHHLFVSLGCATENLVQAAAALGWHAEPSFSSAPADAVNIPLSPTRPEVSPLYQAIPARQSTRGEYDTRPLSSAELNLLEAAGTGPGVSVLLLTDRQVMENVLDFVIQGNSAQVRDPAFVRELKDWVRFNGAHAARTGDGLFAGSSGNPSLPAWLGSLMFDLFFTEQAENDKYARQVRSSAGIAVFVSERDDKAHWVEAGRAFERFALQATALGVRTAHLNQPVEVASLRPAFAGLVGAAGSRPDLVIRFGRGPEMPRSVRRPLEAVLI